MKRIVHFGLGLLLGLAVVWPGMVTAQETEWTCNEGPNDIVAAAEAAYDAAIGLEGQEKVDKLKEAYWLAAQGEALCVSDPDRFRNMQSLRRRANSRVARYFSQTPGTVELGGFGLFMICAGEGSPTVIFETGFVVDASPSWKDIQPAISTMTRTCRYDRRNLGLSRISARLESDVVRTLQDQVDDLVLLLETAEIDPPYVLVGHSWGGPFDLLFTEQYPDWVEGLVLLDAAHAKWLAMVADEVPPPGQNPERIDMAISASQVAGIDSVGDRPLAVVTAMVRPPDRELENELWFELQADFVTFSTNSRQFILENSTHWVQEGDELNTVIEAIMWVLDEVQTGEE